MSHSMASNKEDFTRIPIENKLTSPRQLVNFHSKRHNKSHFNTATRQFRVNLPGRQ